MTDTDKMLTAEEIKDTTKLQFISLENFMGGLGYYYQPSLIGASHFRSYERQNKTRATVSFQTACKLHNNLYQDWHGGNFFKSPFNFSPYSIKKARAGKIVNICNLQLNKKTGFIKVSSNLVSFTEPVYYQMFISSKYFPF